MKVLFVCVGNSCRSQIAEGFARQMGLEAASAGTQPSDTVNPNAIAVMHERGIDISAHTPTLLSFDDLDHYDRVVTMGCGVAESCPTLHTDEDWGLDDPVGHPLDVFRSVRDEIEARVRQLAASADARPSGSRPNTS